MYDGREIEALLPFITKGMYPNVLPFYLFFKIYAQETEVQIVKA